MHGEVHGHEVEAGGGGDCVGVPAEEEDRDVVVPVQELREVERSEGGVRLSIKLQPDTREGGGEGWE